MFSKFSIKAKLMIAFAATAFIPAIVGWVAYVYSSEVIEEYKSIVKQNVPNLEVFIGMNRFQTQMTVPIAALVGSNSTPKDAEKARAEIDKVAAEFDAAAKIYQSAPFAEGEEAAWNDFQNNHWKPYVTMTYDMVRLSGTGKKEDQMHRDELWANEYAQIRKERAENFKKLTQFQLDDSHRKADDGDHKYRQMNTIMLFTITLGLLTCLTFGLLIANYLTKQIQAVIEALRHDSIAVSAASTQLAASSHELSQAATEQSASLQETAASIEELSSMVSKNTESSRLSAESSGESKRKAQEGQESVERMISSMGEIHTSNQAIADQVNSSNTQLTEIISVIREIGEKTKVINDIVFQTKLLSFNASVEAARAGEQGKGFAVVAEEVGNLAAMSGNSAKEITDLLGGSIEKVERIVNLSKTQVEALVSEGKLKVDAGVKMAKQCASVLDQIVENVSNAAMMATDISSASEEQSRGITEMNQAMSQLNAVTHQNASATHQTSEAANSLSEQAESLNRTVKKLTDIIHGEGGRDDSSHSPPGKVKERPVTHAERASKLAA